MNTEPVRFEGGKLCTTVRVRFVNDHRQDTTFNGEEVVGSKFLSCQSIEGFCIIKYITLTGIVLKMVAINEKELLEVMMDGSFCKTTADYPEYTLEKQISQPLEDEDRYE